MQRLVCPIPGLGGASADTARAHRDFIPFPPPAPDWGAGKIES